MKKPVITFLLLFALLLSACGNNEMANPNPSPEGKQATITYQSENGPVQVPADPQRVIVFHPFAGHVIALGVNVVGVDTWAKQNPRFQNKLAGAEVVSEDSLEKIVELEPDLIIGLSSLKNIDKLNEIAPTVTFTYGKLDYLTQFLEIGKLLNKEQEAKAWIDDFQKRAQAAGEEIRKKIGEDATVTIVENFGKELYVYGENFGRGGEVLYQEMKVKMPEKVKEMALKPGYYAVSLEVLPEFVGDYLVLCKNTDSDTSFLHTDTYQNLSAVKNNRVLEANSKEFFFNDPITLEFQLDFFTKAFLDK